MSLDHQIGKVLGGPCTIHETIVPDDDNRQPRWVVILVTGDGDLVMTDIAGTRITYAVTAGERFLFSPVFINEATSATLVGWK